MLIKVDFDYDADYMYCPDCIDQDMDSLIREFVKWIDDEHNNHPFWIDENKSAICYRADAIVYWLNHYILDKSVDQAKVMEKMIKEDKKVDYTIIF